MVKTLYKLFTLIIILMSVAGTHKAIAQAGRHILANNRDTTQKMAPATKITGAKEDAGEISTLLTTPNNNAFYDDKAKYTFEVKNTTNTVQTGKVSYLVTTESGQKLRTDSVRVKIGAKSSGKYDFEIPASKPGFYKVSFMVNVTDYDDTTRRVFGIRPEEIRSQYPRPADFDNFWQKAKDELAKVKPNFKVTPMPKMNSDNRNVYFFEMQSLDNITVSGWMTIPKTKNKKYSVLVGLPGYQVDVHPLLGDDADLAIITLNVRGQGTSRGIINTRKDEFIFYHIDDKNRYVMRGVIMDCLRCIDFIFSRPELRHDNILVSGGSMGGYLSIATASLDKRVTLCSAQNPILCDVHNLVGEVDWPMSSIIKFVSTQPGLSLDKVLANMDYYDTKNFAVNVTCPMLMGIGSLDPFAPPNNEYAAYNNIPGKKRIMVFKDLGHEISQKYKDLEVRWMRDTFALF
jgi:cephalosporin-C deacetylase